MGDEQGQGGVGRGVYFLDENHCRNPYMIDAIEKGAFICEKRLDHFAPGTPDTQWLPVVARHGWALITTDARIRTNLLEREAVRTNRVLMFYFSRNNLAGREMGVALERAPSENRGTMVRRIEAAIKNKNAKELEWCVWYCRMRQSVPSARPADIRYWSGIEAQVNAVLAPPVEAKTYPARKKKAARGLGSIGP